MAEEKDLRASNRFIIDDRFQWRYTGLFIMAIFMAVCLVGGPTFYFVNQNYNLFIQLAYQHSPELLPHLEREKVWINGFLVASMTGMVLFCMFFGIRLTAKMITPVMILQKHIEGLIQGNWNQKTIEIVANEEFEDLLETYNYFYKSYQKQFKNELQTLKHLKLDDRDRNTLENWQELVYQKSVQLNEPTENLKVAN